MLSLVLAYGAMLLPMTTVADEVVVENGRAALENRKVAVGKFAVVEEKDGEVTIHHYERARRVKLRRVAVLVDAEGVAVWPDPLTEKALPGFLTLAKEEAGGDAAGTAGALHHFATKLSDRKGVLYSALVREALLADPANEGALGSLHELPLSDRLAIYRSLLDTHPDSEAIEEAVRASLPEDMPIYGPFETRGWIDYLECADRYGVTILHDPDDAPPEWKAEQRKLRMAIDTPLWGEEYLVAYRSEHLFLITSLSDPRPITACLRRGEGICRALDAMFAEGTQVRTARYPLHVFLFASAEEFEAKGKRGSGGRVEVPHNELDGQYVAKDATTRVFFPGGEEGVAPLLEVFAHELAHQWMHQCCPGVTAGEAAGVATGTVRDRPGFWVVEGFASMVQDFAFDEAGAFTGLDPRSARLDILANAGWKDVLPWPEFLAGTATDFERREVGGGIQVNSRLDPNYLYRVPERRLFFAQAAGLCHYLQSHDADTARQLREYLFAYYRNDLPNLASQKTFRLPAEELGKQARLYATDTVPHPPR